MTMVSKANKLNPYFVTLCISLFLSFCAVSTDNLINHDAVYFMDAAKAFLREGIAASFNVHNWPFYSWLVAIIHDFLWFEHIEQTAHVINAFLTVAICFLFIRIYSDITENNGSLWVAALLILTLVGINRYRADIMRDFAYWCFYLTGFLCLLRYYKKASWQTAIGWQIFLILAFMARLEGLVIIALGPLVIFFKSISIKDRIKQTAALYSVYIVAFAAALFVLLFMESGVNYLPGQLSAITHYLDIEGFVSSYNRAVGKIGEIYWYEGGKDKYYSFLVVVYAFTLLAYVTLRIIGCISLPYFLALCFGLFKKYIRLNAYNKVVIYFISFQFLFFIIYMIKGPVLSSRYTTSLVFMLLLLLGQIIERYMPEIGGLKYKKQMLTALFVYLFVRTADSVISTQGDSKTHVLQAGYWVKDNVDTSIPVYSNYYKALYYTDRGRSSFDTIEFNDLADKLNKGGFESETYLIIKIDQEHNDNYNKKLGLLIKGGSLERIIEFSNDDNDKSVIFRYDPKAIEFPTKNRS